MGADAEAAAGEVVAPESGPEAPAQQVLEAWCPRCNAAHPMQINVQTLGLPPGPVAVVFLLCGGCSLVLQALPTQPLSVGQSPQRASGILSGAPFPNRAERRMAGRAGR